MSMTPLRMALPLLLGASPLLGQAVADTTRLPDQLVTATKVDVRAGIVPASTTVLFADELRARGVVRVQDALREAAGITIMPNGATYGAVTSAFLRGGESDYVKVLLDGVPLNVPGGAIDLANLTLDGLERIEIVRGPASVLYGADAMSGVIQLFSRDGRANRQSDVNISRGSFGNATYRMDIAQGGKATTYSIGGGLVNSDGIYPFNSEYRNRELGGRLQTANSSGTKLSLSTRYSDVTAHYPTDFTGAVVDSNQFDRIRTMTIGLGVTRPLSGYTALAVQAHAARTRRGYENRPDSPGDVFGYGFEEDRDGTMWRRGAEARVDFLRASGSRTSIGAAYEFESEDQTSRAMSDYGTGAFEETGSFTADRKTTSVFSQFYLTPTPFVTLQLGGRLDRNSAFGNFGTWRVGANIQNREGWRLWGAAGTAFKAPTFSELFAASAFEIGNPDLNPERNTSIEVGLRRALPKARGTFSVTGFSQRFRDLIQYVSGAPGDPTYVNLGEVRSRGVEAAVWYKLSPTFNVKAAWTWLRTEVTDTGAVSSVAFTQGEALIRRPAQSGSLTLEYQAHGTTAAVVVNHVGERADADYRSFPSVRATLPSYQTVDLSLTRPLRFSSRASSGLDLTVRGENLFDAEYEQVVGYQARGRTLSVGVRIHR